MGAAFLNMRLDSTTFMKKISFQIITVIFCFIILYACNTKEIRLITNVKYTMVTAHEEDGYVKDPLETSVVVTPQKVLPEFEYGIQYEVLSGEGYFIAADSTIVPAKEGVVLEEANEFSITWKYIGTVAGDHEVAMMTYDNFEKSKTETLVYTIKNVEILWQASSLLTAAKANDTIPITLELRNKTKGRVVSFEYAKKIAVGQGKFLNAAKEELKTEDFTTIDQGTTPLYFIPTTTGTTLLSFDLLDSNGQEKTTAIELEILEDAVNIPPVAIATIKDGGTNKGVAPFTVIFDSSGSMDTDDGISSYLWNFGSADATSELPNPTYTFETPGEYTVQLTVTDASGEAHNDTLLVIVEDTISSDFVAVADTVETEDDTPINIPVLANDQIAAGIMATVQEVSTPLNGGTVVIESDGSITYSPKSGTAVNDSFTYTIGNGLGGTSKAQVTVRVTLGNQPPVAENDTISTPENTATTIAVLEGDQDPENGILTVIATSTPTEAGTVVINDDFTITYTPVADFVGQDTFTYTISDDAGNESTATVIVTITDVDQMPIAVEDTANTPYNVTITINVLDNDTDPEELPLSILAVTTPDNGTAEIDGTTIIYTPNEGFDGEETFTYTIEDEAENTAQGTIIVTVAPRETIAIADVNFEQALIDLNHDAGVPDGLVYKDVVARITELNIGSKEIDNISGIEAFTALTKLDIGSNNGIKTIDLSANIALLELDISDGGFSTIDLSNNILLTSLEINLNSFATIDLSKNTALTYLDAQENALTTIDLSKNIALASIALGDNKLTSVKLPNSPTLISINLEYNALENLDISAINTATTVRMGNNSALTCIQVEDIAIAEANSNWTKDDATFYSLDCNIPRETIAIEDPIFEQYLISLAMDTDGLVNGVMLKEDADKITSLSITGIDPILVGLSTLGGIEYFTNLESLSFNRFTLSDTDLAKTTQVKSLDWGYASSGSLDLTKHLALETISMFQYSFSEGSIIDLSQSTQLNSIGGSLLSGLAQINLKNGNNTSLTTLEITSSATDICIQIDDLDYANSNENWSLTGAYYSIDCSVLPKETIEIQDAKFEQFLIDNNLDTDGVQNNLMYKEDAALVETLSLDGLEITSLSGIEFFTALKKLLAPRNSISAIDLTANSALTALDLSDSELTTIDLSSNTLLNTLGLSDNNLSSIDLNTNTALSLLWLNNNEFASIDISKQPNLTLFQARGNNLTAIDISNSANLNTLDLTANTNLECIQVADQAAAIANTSWQKDATAYFSEDCDATRIAIEDTVFETYLVSENLDTDGIVNGGMFLTDAERVTDITIGSVTSNLKNLLGIEYFINLETLSLSFADINNLDLSKNVQLTSFSWNNGTTSALDLSSNTKLEQIDLSRFSFTEASSIDLSKTTALKEVSITTTNNIASLNIKNGNNAIINNLGVTIGGCIQVDNKADALNNGNWIIDGASYYSIACDAPPKETIPIEDPIFEDYLVNAGIDTDGAVNGEMYKEDAEGVTTLVIGSPSSGVSGLSTLNGIEYFTNLASLTLGYFSKDNMDLSKTTQIKKFNWSYGSTNTLDLSQHTNLEELSFVSFGITGSTALDLTANTALQRLSITSSSTMTMPNIDIKNGANTILTSLTIGATTQNICIQVDNFSDAVNKVGWSIQSNQFYSADCSKGAMVAIPDQNFEQALIDFNIDTDTTSNGGVYLTEAEAATVIVIDNKNIASLEGIAAFTALSTLVVNNNALQTVNLSQNPQIATLILSGNQLTSLDIRANSNLSTLDITSNPSLTCVQVADFNDAYRRNSWLKDNTTYYSEDCNAPRESIAIPDGNFEHYLMDSNLDSYGIMNGVISVEDAENITSLLISSQGSTNPIGATSVSLAGIEYFNTLETLELSYLTVESLDLTSNTALKTLTWAYGNTNSLDLSSNTNLQELRLQTFGFTESDITLDLSNAATLETISIGAINNLSGLNIQNGNNSAITSLGVSSAACIQVDNVTNALNNENWSILSSARYSEDCSAPIVTSLNPSTGEYMAPAGTEIVMDFSNATGTFSHIGDMYTTPGYEIENRFINTFDDVITTTMPASGFAYLGVRLVSGAMTGGSITITHTTTGESHTLLSGAVSQLGVYSFPIP